ncbi:response regulator [Noviherbaspirillum galbum]|uniref:Response regulator n=1 Tax=Noviherbaspirillum galbum TaxID=2709383 RepID=A0A6B3SQ86_9BURK|nr:response regulator [Noviherbaspirillum galbum]NEX62934.1 response regulator [Noviherbaspirillum galbum]
MLKFVVMDTNAISRNLLASVLANGGHEVIGEFNTTPASIATMVKLQPQVVCIDIGDADGDGLGKLDLIRAELPKALLFMVSGQFAAEAVQAGAARGVHGFIVKPFKSATVLTTIRNAIIKIARRHKEGAEQDS